MRSYTFATAAVLTGALALLPTGQKSLFAAGDDKVTLSGCLVRGDGDGEPFLLTNAPSVPAVTSSAPAPVAPGGVGTSGEFANVFYWLYGDSQLKDHVGHRVEIEGDLKDTKDGEIKMDRKDNWTEVEVKADGRHMTARVPNGSMMPAPGTKSDIKGDIKVRRVDVEHIKMTAASCQP